MKTKIGFIGLGKMGKPMSERLLQARHSLAIYDVAPEATKAFAARGLNIINLAESRPKTRTSSFLPYRMIEL